LSKPFDAVVDLQFTPPPSDLVAALRALREAAAVVRIPVVVVRLDASVGMSVPGMVASAEHFGAEVSLDFRPDRRGALLGGFLDLVGPEAYGPGSITLALPSPLPGGGRIERFSATRYRGAISLDLGVVTAAGFASLDLGDPLSVVAVLSGTFRQPIQLSFGFTLVGLGGVVGINRRVDRDGLSAALSGGELGNMLFPADPVGQADQILPALDRCFPVSRGDFFVGPMIKLGWGTPTLVSATLAFIVGTDGVVIVGQVRVSLPCEEAPFALFNVIVLGKVDAAGISIDGSLVNSRIGPVTVDGDARFRLTTGPQGTMALSVGGFHPDYTPPLGMTGMKRLAAELSPLPFASMRIEGYAAITTDTAQLGGAVFLRADLIAAAVDGHASFDAIIFFAPFRFRADFRASLSLVVCGERVAGINVTADFSGPGRWELNGSLTVEILWFDVDVDLHLGWGDPLSERTATQDPVDLVAQQLRLRENWSVASDASAKRMVVMGDPIVGARVPMSPLGELRAVQMAAPLNHEFSRLGGRPMAGSVTVEVTSAGGITGTVDAGFPRGLFEELHEDSLVATGSLLRAQSGVIVGDASLKVEHKTTKQLDFEDALVRPREPFERLFRSSVRADAVFEQMVAAGAAARRRDSMEQPESGPHFVLPEAVRG